MGSTTLDNQLSHHPGASGLLLPRSLRIAMKRRRDANKEVMVPSPLPKRRRVDEQVSVVSPFF